MKYDQIKPMVENISKQMKKDIKQPLSEEQKTILREN